VSLFVVSRESEDRNAVEVDNWSSTNSYLYVKDTKSYFDEPREKLSSRPLCGRHKTISRSSKDFVAKVYTTF
jgi:hypothetical protein